MTDTPSVQAAMTRRQDQDLPGALRKVAFDNSHIMIWQVVKTRFGKLVLSEIRTRPGRDQPIWVSAEIQMMKRPIEGRSL